MLVLTRRKNQRVRLRLKDGPVLGWVTLVEPLTQTSRIGFIFPSDVVIEREELIPAEEHLEAVGPPEEFQ